MVKEFGRLTKLIQDKLANIKPKFAALMMSGGLAGFLLSSVSACSGQTMAANVTETEIIQEAITIVAREESVLMLEPASLMICSIIALFAFYKLYGKFSFLFDLKKETKPNEPMCDTCHTAVEN